VAAGLLSYGTSLTEGQRLPAFMPAESQGPKFQRPAVQLATTAKPFGSPSGSRCSAAPTRLSNSGIFFAALRQSGFGPGLPTLAAAQVVGYLGYTGRHANVAATAALDPLRKSIVRCSRRKDALREGTIVGSGPVR